MDEASYWEQEAVKCKTDVDLLRYRVSIQQDTIELMNRSYHELSKSYNMCRHRLYEYYNVFKELAKINETVFYRSFIIYNYKENDYHVIPVWYPASSYITTRLYKKHVKLAVSYSPWTNKYYVDDETIKYVKNIVNESKWIFKIFVDDIYNNIANGDPELFANLMLQIVHQLKYNVTKYSKYPIETLVEGSGDCDCLAILYATLLEAAGIDAVLLIEIIGDGGAHVQVGVALPSQPDDPLDYYRIMLKYVDFNGKRYYIAETTWDIIKHDPLDPMVIGFFVGDMVDTGKIIEIIDV